MKTASNLPKRRKFVLGITLVELMIVIAILGILVMLTLPVFTSQSSRTHRADAAVVLTNAVLRMESYALANGNSFLGASAGTTIPNKSPQEGDTIHYSISIDNLTATTFLIKATPQNNQAGDSCGVLSIDQAGRRGADESIDDCWR